MSKRMQSKVIKRSIPEKRPAVNLPMDFGHILSRLSKGPKLCEGNPMHNLHARVHWLDFAGVAVTIPATPIPTALNCYLRTHLNMHLVFELVTLH